MKKIILKVTLLALVAIQAAPVHAMLARVSHATLRSGMLRTSNTKLTAAAVAGMPRLQPSSTLLGRTLATQANSSHNGYKERPQDYRKAYAIGSIAAAVTVGALITQTNECSADENENIYDHDFLGKAGFNEGLSHWYLGQFATKFNNLTIGDDLKIKIEFSSYATDYQPDYLSPNELKPLWSGAAWQRKSKMIHYTNSDAPGIRIILTNNTNEEVASCYLTAPGKLSSICVTQNSRGKGYGSMLLSVAKQIALESGINELYIHVYPYMIPEALWENFFDLTKRFYEKNGFIGDRMFCTECAKKDHEIYSNYSRMVCKIIPSPECEQPSKQEPCDHTGFKPSTVQIYSEQGTSGTMPYIIAAGISLAISGLIYNYFA